MQRRAIEKRTGEPVITSKKAADFAHLFTDVIKYKIEDKNDNVQEE
jgi:maleate cis-trans isomerase